MSWLGETTSHSNPNGYLNGTAVFFLLLVALIAPQIAAKKFHPALYCATNVTSTLADFADRSLGIGYTGGSSVLLALVLASLALWYRTEGSVSVTSVNTPRVEAFYWLAITFSQTLGTALGDWMADTSGLGYLGTAAVFAPGLVILGMAYYATNVSRVAPFWAAFVLTQSLGVTVGDFFDKPFDQGGLAKSRSVATAIIAAVTIGCIVLLPQRAGAHPRTKG